MKKIFTILTGIIITTTITFSQTKEKELSNTEKFSATAGSLIEKQFIDIGKVGSKKFLGKDVGGVEIQVLKIKDLNSNASKTALRFSYTYQSVNSSFTDEKIAVLDYDEIDGLIKSLKNIIENVFKTSRDTYTEIGFRSRTGFEAGCYFSLDNEKKPDAASKKMEKVYVTTTGDLYQGKEVFKDDKGTFIWKQVETPAEIAKGKWVTYLKLEKYDSNSSVYLTTEDFKTLMSLIELALPKMQ